MNHATLLNFTNDKMALQGKVCIVTGASRGIGKGIALQLAEAGATVYITGIIHGKLTVFILMIKRSSSLHIQKVY